MAAVELAQHSEKRLPYREFDVSVHGKNWHTMQVGDPAGPNLLGLHGVMTSGALCFKEAVVHLAQKGFKVTVPDMPGYGQSDRPEQFSTDDFADGVLDFMDEVGIGETHTMGVSFGGGVEVGMAKKAQGRIQSVTLIDAWVAEERLHIPYVDTNRLGNAVMRAINVENIASHIFNLSIVPQAFLALKEAKHVVGDLAHLRTDAVRELTIHLADRFIAGHEYFSDEDLQAIIDKEAWRTMFSWLKTEITSHGPRTNYLPYFDSAVFHHPTLILKGGNDKLLSRDWAKKVHGKIPDSQLYEFDDLGHGSLPIQEAERFASLVAGFISQSYPSLRLSA